LHLEDEMGLVSTLSTCGRWLDRPGPVEMLRLAAPKILRILPNAEITLHMRE